MIIQRHIIYLFVFVWVCKCSAYVSLYFKIVNIFATKTDGLKYLEGTLSVLILIFVSCDCGQDMFTLFCVLHLY